MNLENIMHSEVSLAEKDKYCTMSLIMSKLKNYVNEGTYKIEIDSQI